MINIAGERIGGSAVAVLVTVLVLGFTGGREPQTLKPTGDRSTRAESARSGFAGQLLVATDELRDPRFFHTVIYLVRHDESGAMGIVINRPLAEVPVSELLEQVGRAGHGAKETVRVHYGGPVEPRLGFMLHTADFTTSRSQVVGGDVAMTAAPDILEALATGKGPRRNIFALGYAGWAAGQLEGEIQRGSWIVIPSDDTLLFGGDHEEQWERAIARRKIDV